MEVDPMKKVKMERWFGAYVDIDKWVSLQGLEAGAAPREEKIHLIVEALGPVQLIVSNVRWYVSAHSSAQQVLGHMSA